MAGDNEPAKLLLPYLQRADELQKHEPLVAYYCRLYAMERGLKIPKSDRTKTTDAILVSLIKQLEKDKKSLSLSPDDQLHIEGFALNVFSKADKQDRAGRADLNTAKTFYAASIFFEILNQFGQVQSDLEQKQRYAAWKAADIRKAIKEGRKPLPGPPGGEDDIPSNEPGREYDLEQRTNSFSKPGTDMDYPHDPRNDQTGGPTYGTDSSPQVNNTASFQHPPNIAPSAYNNVASPPNLPTSPSYPANDHSHNFHQPPNDPSDNSYSHLYRQQSFPEEHHQQPFPQEHHRQSFLQEPHQQPFPQEPHQQSFPQEHHQQSFPQEHHQLPSHFPSQETPLYLYPNFQSYPIVPETSLPAYTSSPPSQHHPSYQQGPESGYPTAPPPAAGGAKYAPPPPPSSEYESSGRNGSVAEANPPPAAAKAFHYDSNYMPAPEKIVEAHKAARFAVGALAFDDVPTAVEHLKRSLELLTNPSAGGH